MTDNIKLSTTMVIDMVVSDNISPGNVIISAGKYYLALNYYDIVITLSIIIIKIGFMNMNFYEKYSKLN